jgi:hypothetical protein
MGVIGREGTSQVSHHVVSCCGTEDSMRQHVAAQSCAMQARIISCSCGMSCTGGELPTPWWQPGCKAAACMHRH